VDVFWDTVHRSSVLFATEHRHQNTIPISVGVFALHYCLLCCVFISSDGYSVYKSSSWRWDTRTWRDVSSYYLFTYLPLNYFTPV